MTFKRVLSYQRLYFLNVFDSAFGVIDETVGQQDACRNFGSAAQIPALRPEPCILRMRIQISDVTGDRRVDRSESGDTEVRVGFNARR